MFYDSPFWSDNLEGMHVIWLPESNSDKDSTSLLDRLGNFNESNWFENISYFEPVENHSNILSGWIGGCEFFEKFDDEKVATDCTALLRRLLNRNDIPMPKYIKRY